MQYLDETTQTYKEITVKALDGMPIGSIIQFAGSVIPNGWMICDGRTLRVGLGSNQTYLGEYADLYKVIGTTYGYVDYPIPLVGAIDFKIPDLRGKVSIGLDGNDTDFDTLGETGGSKYLQAHDHVQYRGYQVSGFSAPYMSTMTGWGFVDSTSGTELHNIGTAGSGNSGNLQPYLVVNYIIKVKNTAPTMASVVNATNSSTEDSYSCGYINDLLNTIFPVGKTEIFYDNNDHSNYLGFTWERTAVGKAIVGIDTTQTEFDTIGETGGSKSLQEHTHGMNISSGGAAGGGTRAVLRVTAVTNDNPDISAGSTTSTGTGNSGNLQPYEVFAIWRRTA